MNGLEFVRDLLDQKYAYLLAYEKYPPETANSLVGNILMDLNLKMTHGLSVYPIFMDADCNLMYTCDLELYPDFTQYYCLATDDRRVPIIEYNGDVPIVYNTFEQANEILSLYYDYFFDLTNEITTYKP